MYKLTDFYKKATFSQEHRTKQHQTRRAHCTAVSPRDGGICMPTCVAQMSAAIPAPRLLTTVVPKSPGSGVRPQK